MRWTEGWFKLNKKLIIDGISQVFDGVFEGTTIDWRKTEMVRTPERYARACEEMFDGYGEPPVIKTFPFTKPKAHVKIDCNFVTTCEHHDLGILGRATVAYMPRDCVIGLSKIPRLVHHYAHRYQIQEGMCKDIATHLHNAINPEWTYVYLRGIHLCSYARGIKTLANMYTGTLLPVYIDVNKHPQLLAVMQGCENTKSEVIL
jgi:GTP cyclohydrolase I